MLPFIANRNRRPKKRDVMEGKKTISRDSDRGSQAIPSDSPPDLTGQVTKSRNHPFASGGFGDIYTGIWNTRGKSVKVVIKTTRVYLQHDEDLPKKKKQFRRETTVWWKLKHPNVLPLFGTIWDHDTNPDIPAMVCPWVENSALSIYLEKNMGLTIATRLALANDVAHGLQYLHSQKVVHGDLSGGNVLVDGDGRACIADFGLSTLLTRLGGSTFAMTHQAKGTTRWMAPELLSTEDNFQATPTMQSDVYSFGSIMLQILTGNVPYHHLSRNIPVMLAVATGEKPRRPDEGAITDHRWQFIEWCWSPAKGKKLRPSSDEIVEFTEKDLAGQHSDTGTHWQAINDIWFHSPCDITGQVAKSSSQSGADPPKPNSTVTVGQASTPGECAINKMEALISSRDLTGHVTKSSNHPFASGTFGDIYRGYLDRGGQSIDVAIKTHRLYMWDDEHLPEKMKQLRKELTVWLDLEHPNVLPLLGIVRDLGMNPYLPAMVCPSIANGTLTTYLEKNKHLTVPQRMGLVHDIARGLQYLHSQHIVHGDLSGSNVLVDADGKACIAGFGLSVSLTRPEESTFAMSRQARGTARWAAPELFRFDDSKITPSTPSDVYSFGSIMLQILTGSIPYHDITREEQVILAVATGLVHKRPDQTVVTDDRWNFMEWCWTPVDASKLRPISDQIVQFTEKNLAETAVEAV